jgi:hypothetical protein
MITLYKYCDKCKTEKNFDAETLECKTCKTKNKPIK